MKIMTKLDSNDLTISMCNIRVARFVLFASLIAVAISTSCSGPVATNVTDNADQAAIDAYRAAIAEEQEKMPPPTK